MSSGIETNKIAGAVLTALLVTVGIGHFGAALFGSGEHGETELAYPVAAGTGTSTEPEAPEVVPTVLPLLADASAEDGERLFAACRGCHTNTDGGANGVGPNLWGVVGADIAAHPGYTYSDALLALEGTWTYDALNHFIHAPRDYSPGTKMTYPGMPDVEGRADLIAYLHTLSSDPIPLPTQDEIDAAVAEQQAAEGGAPAGDEGAAAEGGEGAGTDGTEATGTDDAAEPDAAGDGGAAPEATGEPVSESSGEETVSDLPASEESSADEVQTGDDGAQDQPAGDAATEDVGTPGGGPETSGEPVAEPFGEETVGDLPASEDSSADEPQLGNGAAEDGAAGDESVDETDAGNEAVSEDDAAAETPTAEEAPSQEPTATDAPVADEPAADEPAAEEILPEDRPAEGQGG